MVLSRRHGAHGGITKNSPCTPCLREILSHLQVAAIAVTQKPEIVLQGVIINILPLVAHSRRDEQQQRALRLVEVGDDGIDDAVAVAGANHNAS